MESLSDRELVVKACQGDVESYALLVRHYSNAVLATALSVIHDFHLAQDVAQEAFVKAWFHLGDLKDANKFGSWLFTITKRLCVDHSRKRKSSEILEPTMTDNVTLEEIVSRRDLKKKVWHAIDELEEHFRLVTVMYFISGFTSREISRYLNVSVSAVESRIRRAKEKLKKELLVVMEELFAMNKVGDNFQEEVVWRIVPRIATIEIPVSNLKRSIEWYSKILGIKVVHQNEQAAMLHLQGGNRIGVPTLYLVQTQTEQRLSFLNTNTGIIHSVIDFYMPDLVRFHAFLKNQGIEVTDIHYIPELKEGMGGFGFKDPDGNSLSVCNVVFNGQV